MDHLELCPYNIAHHVYSSRLQIHILKCSKRSPIPMKVCPYDATHHVKVEEYENHLRECPNNKTYKGSFLDFRNEMQYKHWVDEMFSNESQSGSSDKNSLEENWDDIVDQVGTYNAEEISKHKKVIRNPTMQSKNERRRFLQQEKKRYKALLMQERQEKWEEAHLDEADERRQLCRPPANQLLKDRNYIRFNNDSQSESSDKNYLEENSDDIVDQFNIASQSESSDKNYLEENCGDTVDQFNTDSQSGSSDKNYFAENCDDVDQFNFDSQSDSSNKNYLEENWDNIVDQVGTYNAEEMSKNKKVLRTPTAGSKNEHRKFRQLERIRYNALQGQERQEEWEETHLDEPDERRQFFDHLQTNC